MLLLSFQMATCLLHQITCCSLKNASDVSQGTILMGDTGWPVAPHSSLQAKKCKLCLSYSDTHCSLSVTDSKDILTQNQPKLRCAPAMYKWMFTLAIGWCLMNRQMGFKIDELSNPFQLATCQSNLNNLSLAIGRLVRRTKCKVIFNHVHSKLSNSGSSKVTLIALNYFHFFPWYFLTLLGLKLRRWSSNTISGKHNPPKCHSIAFWCNAFHSMQSDCRIKLEEVTDHSQIKLNAIRRGNTVQGFVFEMNIH